MLKAIIYTQLVNILSRKKIIGFTLVCLFALSTTPIYAAYVQRYSTINNGAITFTGNTIGLNKTAGANTPGTNGAIGTFIAAGATTQDGTYPVGTTSTWQANASRAVLTIPAGSVVLYAELIWSGSYSYGGENVSASLGNSVTFATPLGTNSVAPVVATAQTLGTAGTGGAAGTCATTPCYYVRSANVTALVQAAGPGTYSVGGIPATQGNAEDNANTGGWTLAVAYQNSSLPSRNLTLFVGAEVAGSAAATVSGFCTPPTGPRSGRLAVSAIEGDSNITGDAMRFGPTAGTTVAISGPNNPVGNFFASQINGDTGALDTSGTFGASNSPPGGATSGARQGYDITNVDVSATLLNNQITAAAQGTTTGDNYMINALGLQINVGAPSFLLTTKAVDKATAVVGDTLTYTVRMDNTGGTADASSVVFTDVPPNGTNFVAGSVTVDGVANAGNPSVGIAIGTVPAGGSRTVVFKVVVSSIPAAPAAANYPNSATWAYQFISCAGQPSSSGTVTTNPVTTTIARLAVSKAVTPAGTATPGTTLTYTVTLNNDGTAASTGTTLQDLIPTGTTYVPGSTLLNGLALADVAGAMPYVATRTVNSAGQAAGVLAVGASATVSFVVSINNATTITVTNTATGDIDGAGAAAAQTATVATPIQRIANLTISKTNGVSSVVAGGTTAYAITVSNLGPSGADGAVVADPPAVGLSCTSVSCSVASGAAACPAPLTLTAFQAGAAIPAFPANSSLVFVLNCDVTATGL
jgi:large repetitive protein